MRAVLACLLIAGCATSPAAPPARTVAEPIVMPVPVPAATPVATEQRIIVSRETRAVAEAKRYVAWKQSKPPIIDRLTVLTRNAQKMVALMQAAKTTQAKLDALVNAEAAVSELQQYLITKGD